MRGERMDLVSYFYHGNWEHSSSSKFSINAPEFQYLPNRTTHIKCTVSLKYTGDIMKLQLLIPRNPPFFKEPSSSMDI
jgi:hypothetical protein